MLSETIKNTLYFSFALVAASFLFMYSDGSGFLFMLGWAVSAGVTIIYALNLFSNGLSLIMGLMTLPLYFDNETDKQERLKLDLANLLTVIADLLILLACYQLIQQYGNVNLPKFEPFGIQFVYNFSY